MNRLRESCREYSEVRKIAVVKEEGKKYSLFNNSGFIIDKYRIDGCIAQAEGKRRCDYLFLTSQQPQTAYFIELKGGDTVGAVEQIRDTIEYLKPELKNFVFKARTVGVGNAQNLENTVPYRELLSLIKGKKNFNHAANKQYSETI